MEWRAEYNIEPFGEERADIRSAIVAHTVYAMQCGRGSNLKISDFMPNFEPAPVQCVAEMQARLLAATGAKIANG